MTDGLLLPPGGGRKIQTMTLKAGAERRRSGRRSRPRSPPDSTSERTCTSRPKRSSTYSRANSTCSPSNRLPRPATIGAPGSRRPAPRCCGADREASCSCPPAARMPSSTQDPNQPGCSSSYPRPATRSTFRNSPTCLPPEAHRTKLALKRYGAATTFISSRPSQATRPANEHRRLRLTTHAGADAAPSEPAGESAVSLRKSTTAGQ
jgi:hypothetical protein